MTKTESIKRIVRIFKLRNARLLLLVRVTGQSGDGLLQTALTSFVLFSPERQNSAVGIAVAFGILLLPYSIVGPFVGIFIDRWSRQQILFWANILRATLMLAICGVVLNHGQNALLAILVLTSLGATRFIQACLAASVPHVVTRAHLVTANALFPTLGTTSAAIAAGLGIGAQRYLGASDKANALIIIAGSFCTIVASVAATFIRPRTVLGPHGTVSKLNSQLQAVAKELGSGIQVLQKLPLVRQGIFAASLQRFAFGITTIYALILSRTKWSTGGQITNSISDFGACAGSAALGGFVAAIISALLLSESDSNGQRILRQQQLRRAAIITCLVSTPLIYFLLIAASLISVCLAAFVIAFAGQLLKIHADTTIQALVDDLWRGRVFAIFDMLLNGSLVLGITLYAALPIMQNGFMVTALVTSLTFVVCASLIKERKSAAVAS